MSNNTDYFRGSINSYNDCIQMAKILRDLLQNEAVGAVVVPSVDHLIEMFEKRVLMSRSLMLHPYGAGQA